ncbi:MAG TPA: hypothetical protein VGX23_37950 [Actinocrinis sp.]|nr:hypothetical protein [Actinocrinis sp.]
MPSPQDPAPDLAAESAPESTLPSSPEPRTLANLASVLADARPDQRGALWSLTEPGRQLDANLVQLPADATVDAHVEPDLDVLLLVVSGNGRLTTDQAIHDLFPSTLLWLPKGSRRALAAGPDGLVYLTTHRARPGMQIRPPQT